jgi:N-sulfoglucosamine sulfohydrolase
MPFRFMLMCLVASVFNSEWAFAQQPVPAVRPRPNIVVLFADDWGRYASCYAADELKPSPNSIVKTPNIDSVALSGVRFTNAFVNAPSCTPCRSALLSGQYFFRTGKGAILNGAEWDSNIPSFPHLLHAAGYSLGETYKVWSPGTPNDAPFGAGKFAFEKAGNAFNNFSENATKYVKEGLTFEAAKAKLLADVQGNLTQFLKQRDPNQPFLYWFGPTLVHRAWEKGSGKALWDIDPNSLTGKLPKFLPDVPTVREDFADYLGEIQAWDAGVGVILQELRTQKLLDNTVIIISGDHGAPGFPGGKCNLYDFGVGVTLLAQGPGIPKNRVVQDFVNLMDVAPTICELAGVKPELGMTGRSFVKQLTSDKTGWIDPTRNWVVTGRERHVANAREENLPYPQRALRTDKYLYIRNFKPERWPMGNASVITDSSAPPTQQIAANTHVAFADMDASPTKGWLVEHRLDPQWQWHYNYAFGKRPLEELYDLTKDPEQTVNIAADATYAAIKTELATQLTKILTENSDPRVLNDGTTFDKPPYTSPRNEGNRTKKKQP